MHLIEDSSPMTFDVEKVQACDELQTIWMDKKELMITKHCLYHL